MDDLEQSTGPFRSDAFDGDGVAVNLQGLWIALGEQLALCTALRDPHAGLQLETALNLGVDGALDSMCTRFRRAIDCSGETFLLPSHTGASVGLKPRCTPVSLEALTAALEFVPDRPE